MSRRPINVEEIDVDEMTDDALGYPEVPSMVFQSSEATITTATTLKRGRKSTVWDDFNVLDVKDFQDGIERVECKKCRKIYKANSTKNGTGTLRSHQICPKRENVDVGQMLMVRNEGQMIVRDKKKDQDFVHDKITKLVVRHELPLAFVEYEEFKELISYLFSDYAHISRNTQMTEILKLFRSEGNRIKSLLYSFNGKISLTSDLWTSISNDGYISLTAHYIDKDWVLHKKLLSFCIMPPRHTGMHISNMVSQIMIDWGIERKLFSITLDNATSNFSFVEMLKMNLNFKNALLCNGEFFFHNRCCAHILNLIVHDGLKCIDESIELVRSSVHYVKTSQARKVKFLEVCKQVGLESNKGLHGDVATRWNSTYLMIESAIFYRKAFEVLKDLESNYQARPNSDQWSKIECLIGFLHHFYEITVLLSGSKYLTSNLYFDNIWEIHLNLLEEISNERSFMRSMTIEMKKKFDKYWSGYSIILAIALIFDPRYKLDFVKWAFSKVAPLDSIANVMFNKVKIALYQLFDEYKSMHKSGNENLSSAMPPRPGKFRTRTEFTAFVIAEMDSGCTSQLDLYLSDPKIPCTDNDDNFDVLAYWKANGSRYSDVARMARDVLAILVSTVASESAFSAGGRVIDKYRSKLLPTNAEALICLRDWMFDVDFRAEPADDLDELNNALGNVLGSVMASSSTAATSFACSNF